MFTTFLIPLPPPPSSLLPILSQPTTETVHQSHPHHPQARRKPASRFNTPLTTLSHDERLIASRKLAIAMYGYSWLKPAGCTKTMLGRREEELEREEVERQLREVELQERMATEQEEQERREELRRQAEGGEVEGIGERDLDDEVPEADEDAEGEEDSEDVDGDEEGEEEEDMEGNLDDDIPEADATGQESSWVYDTRRESDTESEVDRSSENATQTHPRLSREGNMQRQQQQGRFLGSDDPAATEAMVNAMLDEDELGDYEHQQDLDDEVPDMDEDLDMDMDMDANLSDEVPDADANTDVDEDPGWEHTDSELEESEMDISLLPPHPSSTSRSPGTTHEEMRRISGNRMLPPPLPIPSSTGHAQRQRWPNQGQAQAQPQPQPQIQPRTAPRRNLRAMMQTPDTADEVSALISSTGGTDTSAAIRLGAGPIAGAEGQDSIEPRSPNRRSWLNPAAARRNLFAGFRGGPSSLSNTTSGNAVAGQATVAAQPRNPTIMGIRSGGLFTPSPRQTIATGSPSSSDNDNSDDRDEEGRQLPEQPQSRTRSGRLLGGFPQVGRRARRAREGET